MRWVVLGFMPAVPCYAAAFCAVKPAEHLLLDTLGRFDYNVM